MDDYKEQQKEALITTHEYIQKLKTAIPKAAGELKGQMLDDTVDYLKAILNGVNFVTEVFNRTRDYLNGDKERLNKDKYNDMVLHFMEAYREGPKERIGEALEEDILTYVTDFDAAIVDLLGLE